VLKDRTGKSLILSTMHKTGSLIVLAWPDTLIVKPGAWYDLPAEILSISKNNYYKAGHSAAILISHQEKTPLFFDFGRYHTPRKTGRVRDKVTDPELTINSMALFNHKQEIINIEEILLEVAKNNATHGNGKMIASVYSSIDFIKVFNKAKGLQNKDAIRYGPFDIKGNNCSRFVAQLAKAGTNNPLIKLLFTFPYTLTATPIFNIRLANGSSYMVRNGKAVKTKHTIKNLIRFPFSKTQK